ncbi:MAG TPA: alkaline phosphatase family protein, partial [Verrucomicrobiae bacterium]|nr:alkaline phosphatase family protein [Verrucomicrobiae bacterium]
MTAVTIFLAASLALTGTSSAALPSRLVLLLDGVPYQVVRDLQEGVECTAKGAKAIPRQAFQHGYFPASRLISTFPSISDIAWTDIMGNDPTPGYQRTYFSANLASEVTFNGVTGLLDYERQMNWHLEGKFRRTMSYSAPMRTFKYELNQVIEAFLQSGGEATHYYYALINGTDIAQHSWGDVGSMLCLLDEKLAKLRATYRAREGRELQVLILSDHGNDRAGGGKRIGIRRFLKKHGYRVAKIIAGPKDVVLPTAGIESWAEMHNLPGETSNLVQVLSQLEGVDLVTARNPLETNRFIVRNAQGEQAEIVWKAEGNRFKYEIGSGDPLDYRNVVNALSSKGALD